MQSTRFVPALLGALALGAVACGEDVGSCDDPVEARDTVLVGNGSVQYAGQAIMNQSCANGSCHASGASGESRSGAPKHLNFDLRPAKSSGEDENPAGERIAKIDDEDLAGLRRRQQRVVDERDVIWEQVKKNLMPPDGAFAALRELTKLFDTEEGDVCTASKESFDPITSSKSKEVLRNWLACGAPIVETNSELVEKRTAGTVGYQYPVCGGGEIDISSIEDVQTRIFGEYCSGCHPSVNDPDLSDADMSFASLVEDDSEACDGKPFVTPGDVEKSYLIDLLTKEEPGCHRRMPDGGDPLSEAEIQAVADWIEAGAKR